MRVDRRLLALIAVIAVLALFIDGFAYVYRLATNQALTGPIRGVPTLNIGFLGFSQQIYVHKGLDLQGGTHLELQITQVRTGTKQEARDIAVAIIERRVNSSGYAESVVRPEGENRIIVELPGVNLEQAKQILGKTSYLTIWKWEPGTPDAATLQLLNPTDAQKYPGNKPVYTQIDGSMITNASRSTDPNTNLPDVTISFNSKGSDLFCAFTRDRVTHPQNDPQNKLAIFIDKDLVEDANVISEICGGSAIITGGFTPASAQALAIQLNSGALPGTVSLASATEVGATLGASTVKLSLLAGNPRLEHLDADHLLRPLFLRRSAHQGFCHHAGDWRRGQHVLRRRHHPAVPADRRRTPAGPPLGLLRRAGTEGRVRAN